LARRLVALVVLVVTINMTWHFLRAWLPKYLIRLGYSQNETNFFSSAYYLFTDAGALTAGFVALKLARRGVRVHTSRRLVFLGCALLPLLCLAVPLLPRGPLLLGSLLAVGFGALGVFPAYYSFSQDLTVRHQGKLTGTLGCLCWLAMFGWQEVIGQLVSGKGWLGGALYHGQGSYAPCFVIAGLAPLVGFLALLLLWGPVESATRPAGEAPTAAPADERILGAPRPPVEERVQPG
jgi:ACS family hexuronate transporter-like MFS transporter